MSWLPFLMSSVPSGFWHDLRRAPATQHGARSGAERAPGCARGGAQLDVLAANTGAQPQTALHALQSA